MSQTQPIYLKIEMLIKHRNFGQKLKNLCQKSQKLDTMANFLGIRQIFPTREKVSLYSVYCITRI